MTRQYNFLISCEHGGNRIPSRYRYLFTEHEALLQTHRGYDAGARSMAADLAKILAAPLFVSLTSRLLIDLNRSIGHSSLYSEATRTAPAAIRREIMRRYYLPYRRKIESEIAKAAPHRHRTIHLSSHSFTPELNGQERIADIGLLYDPARIQEVELCKKWRMCLKTQAPALKVRLNYPYAGKSDCLAAYLRRRFSAEVYAGIELEINQKHAFKGGRHWQSLRTLIAQTLCLALHGSA